jgi:hypothetical protein
MYVFWAVFHPMAKVTVHNCAVRLAESQPRLTVEYDHMGTGRALEWRLGAHETWNSGWLWMFSFQQYLSANLLERPATQGGSPN